MPRVLRIINRLNLGGPTYNAAYLTAHMAPEFETLLVAGMRDETEESSEYILDELHLKPRYIHAMHREIDLRNDYQAYRDLSELIRKFKPDIVHTHAAKAGALGRIAAYRAGVPVILHTFHGHVFHGYFNKLKTGGFIGIERAMARISTGIIAISEQQRYDLSARYKICPEHKIKTIPLGFDLSRFETNQEPKRREFRNKYGLRDDQIAIGIIGRMVGIKNHPLFLRAWKELTLKYGDKIQAFIIGDGEDRDGLLHLSSELGIRFRTPAWGIPNANLTYTSWIHRIEDALAGLDIVALSSNNEGTPVSLIEAQAAGKAIVSTNAGGVKDTVDEGETALLVQPHDLAGFTDALDELISNDALRHKFIRNGPAFAQSKFKVARLVGDMSDYYRELLSATEKSESKVSIKPTGPTLMQGEAQPKKVLQIVNRLNLGGITYNAACIASGLRPEFETLLVAGQKEPDEESSAFILERLGIRPVLLERMIREISPAKDLKSFRQLVKIIRQFKPDIVHTHGAKAGLLGRLAAKWCRVPVILHTYHGHVFHSYFGPLKTRFILQLERTLAGISTRLIAISAKQQQELTQQYSISSEKRFEIIELGYDLAPFSENQEQKRFDFRASFGIAPDKILVGIIGRLVPIKNIPLMLNAWAMLPPDYRSRACLFLIGDGEDRSELESLCKHLGLLTWTPEKHSEHAEVYFTSWIREADKAMAGMDIVALSSLNEGTPASLIEAMAAGKPIVTTNVGGISDMVTQEVNALIVESGNPTQLSSALQRIISDKNLRDQMTQVGPQTARERYSDRRLTEEMRALYRKLLKVNA